MKKLLIMALICMAPVSASAADAPQPPNEFVQAVADDILARLDGRRAELSEDTEALHTLVREVLDPVFDFQYAARLVLGVHGRRATPEQLQRFEKSFYDFLVITYAEGLVKFTSDRIRVLPFRGKMDPRRTLAKTEVFRDDGTPVPVDYALRMTRSGWKVYDVVIEGISYVTNYRNELNTQIGQEGLDAVIQRFEEKVAEKRAPNDAGSDAEENAAEEVAVEEKTDATSG